MTLHEDEADARVYSGLGCVIRSTSPVADIAGIKGDEARIAAGITVYRNNVRAAFLRVLRDTFPVVYRLVGEEFFRYLAHEYFHAQPASSPLVARYGDRLPEFLGAFKPASGLPYLADVARLELAWLGSYHAAEADCLEPGVIFAAIGDDPGSAQFDLHPSMRLLSSPYPIHAIWLHNRCEPNEKLRLPEGGENVLVKRPAHHVFTETLIRPVWTALAALGAGKTLEEALNAAIEGDPAASAAEIIRAIATSEIITSVRKAA